MHGLSSTPVPSRELFETYKHVYLYLEGLSFAQSRSMQKPLRLSRDADGRTDRRLFSFNIVDFTIKTQTNCDRPRENRPSSHLVLRPLQINFLFPVHRPHLFHLSTKNSIISVFFHYFRVFLYTQVFKVARDGIGKHFCVL